MKKNEKQPKNDVLEEAQRKLWAQFDKDDLEWQEFIDEEERKIRLAEEESRRMAGVEQNRSQLVLHAGRILRQMQELEKQMVMLMSLSDEALTLGDQKKNDAYRVRIHELDQERDNLKEKLDSLTALMDESSWELPHYHPSKDLRPNTPQTPPSQFLH